MTSVSDTHFDPTENIFTVAEAAQVSRVSEYDIRNWMRRNVVPVGTKSRVGRIMFNALDIVYLKVIGDLNTLLSVDPSVASRVAAHVTERSAAWLQRDNTHLHATVDGYRKETRLLLHIDRESGEASLTPFEWGNSVLNYKIPDRDTEYDWARRPTVVFPVEQIFEDVFEELWAILEGEEGNG